MKILVSWSSGKDSAWMLDVLREQHPGAIGALLTTLNAEANRVAMHAVRRELVEAQADALGLPLWPVLLPVPCSNAVYAAEMAKVLAQASAAGFTHVAFGDLFLEDVRQYRERQLAGSPLAPLFPLWGRPTAALARDMIARGLRAIVTCVDPRWLRPTDAGRPFDDTWLASLPPGVDPCGERGEFHTFAWDGPMFRRPIAVRPGERVFRDGFVFADLLPA
jgi:uncharacterized protein (TIGR00290 family)